MGKVINIIEAMWNIIKEHWDIVLIVLIAIAYCSIVYMLASGGTSPELKEWFNKSILNMNIGDLVGIVFIYSLFNFRK